MTLALVKGYQTKYMYILNPPQVITTFQSGTGTNSAYFLES